MLTTTCSTPAEASRSIAWSISGRPSISTSGLGIVSVRGRSRVPSPAVGSCLAFEIGPPAGFARQVAIEPARDRGQGRMPEVGFEQSPDARDVGEVLALAVAFPQPREDPEDLAIALGRENCGRAQEGVPVELRKSSEVALGHRLA